MTKQDNLHVGLVGPLPTPFGGMANQTQQLLTLLKSEGIRVSFVQTNPLYKPRLIEKYPKIRAVFRLVPYMGKLWELAGKVDVIHVLANSGWSWQLFAAPAIWIGQLRKTPVIVNYRGGEAKFYFKKAIKRVRLTMLRGNALIVPSNYLRDVFAEFNLTAEVIPNIIDLDRFKPRAKRDSSASKAPRIIVTRNLERIYDISTAIRAISILRNFIPEVELYIAGSGQQEHELKALVEQLGLGSIVTFTGKIPPDEMAELYRTADIMLNPTTVDNMPNSVLESMGSGVPVVTTNVGGIPYIVKDGESALFVQPCDAEAMAEQAKRLLQDPELYKRLQNNGLKEVQQYTWSAIKGKWLDLYQLVSTGAMGEGARQPRVLVLSTLFPHDSTPNTGLFIRERMFRVGHFLPLMVVSPQPWFPGQALIRLFRPDYRPAVPRQEKQQGIEVLNPRFFSFPVIFKQLDGFLIAVSTYPKLRRLYKQKRFNILDAHFAYPDGYAAVRLGRWLRVPVSITLRGTEIPHSRNQKLRPRLIHALEGADRIFTVSESLRRHAIGLGIDPAKIQVMANGVDMDKFYPEERLAARRRFGIPKDAKVMVSVGALVERKGFHRVIALLPALIAAEPDLHYLIVGGAGPEGNMEAELQAQVASLQLEQSVHFLGSMPPDEIRWPLSAADLFVLSTRNEGWANVFLEAMACGLPVVTTDVGGNAEVVCRKDLGIVVPYGDNKAMQEAIRQALEKTWDRDAILAYAKMNKWDSRIASLTKEFGQLHRNDIKSPIGAVR